jgi:hypothetical protein
MIYYRWQRLTGREDASQFGGLRVFVLDLQHVSGLRSSFAQRTDVLLRQRPVPWRRREVNGAVSIRR